jgi:D-alanyl-D-alanine carboxypeptidase/D-alanyl-D-alanine-endopeptidase (penicillin-binding protein 4)
VAVAPQNERNDGWGGLLTNPLPQVQDARTPTSAKPLAYVLSNPLKDVLKDMNYFSNNVMARQIYLTLSKERYGVGSIEASSQVVSAEMAKLGLKMDTLQMGNGSGLARDTAISAAQLGQLLAKAANEPALYESLPIIGVSGTVQNRLKNTDMVGRGHIKTGSLSDVRAIAGYIDGKSGTRYAIVSIIQGASAQSEAGKKLHDVFMQWVGAQ